MKTGFFLLDENEKCVKIPFWTVLCLQNLTEKILVPRQLEAKHKM